jgi:hypothetical protein
LSTSGRGVQARKNLYAIMGVMRDVRVRDERTQAMFAPLKETVTLLKAYGVPVKDETVSQLEDGPTRWKALDKKKKQRTEALNAKARGSCRGVWQAQQGHACCFAMHREPLCLWSDPTKSWAFLGVNVHENSPEASGKPVSDYVIRLQRSLVLPDYVQCKLARRIALQQLRLCAGHACLCASGWPWHMQLCTVVCQRQNLLCPSTPALLSTAGHRGAARGAAAERRVPEERRRVLGPLPGDRAVPRQGTPAAATDSAATVGNAAAADPVCAPVCAARLPCSMLT